MMLSENLRQRLHKGRFRYERKTVKQIAKGAQEMSLLNTDAYYNKITDDYINEQQKISEMCLEFTEMRKERDKYKKALEEIIAQGYGSLDYYSVAKEALK